MEKLSQISVVYAEEPFIIVDYVNVQVTNGRRKLQALFEELGAYVNIAAQQALTDGKFVNWTKGFYLFNNKLYDCIVIAVQDANDPPITNYKKRRMTVLNTSANNIGIVLLTGAINIDNTSGPLLFLAPGETATDVSMVYFPDAYNPDGLAPQIIVFDAGTGPADPLNITGTVPLSMQLVLNGMPMETVYGNPSGKHFRFSTTAWNAAWDTLNIFDGTSASTQYVVKTNAALPGICATAGVFAYHNGLVNLAPGDDLYSDYALTIPLPGNFVVLPSGIIHAMAAGIIGAATGTTCFGNMAETSNVVAGGVRIQKFQLTGLVSVGSVWSVAVYSHIVSYPAVAGDTIQDILNNLVILINNTTPVQWNDMNSAPNSGTAGFPPSASIEGTDTLVLRLNIANQFAAWVV